MLFHVCNEAHTISEAAVAEEALAQVSDKNYTLPFAIEDQQIIRLGINFDSSTRNIDKVLVG